MRPRAALAVALALAAMPLCREAWGESAIDFPIPELVGEITASTYDEAGERIGPAELSLERVGGDQVRLFGRSAIQGSAQAEFSADFSTDGGGGGLRLLRQRSESRDPEGRSLGVMTIDHRAGTATCGSPEGTGEGPVTLKLPGDDRVVNIPLNMLFAPLVRGERDEVEFQLLLCRVGGGRFVDARAEVVRGAELEKGAIQVKYQVDLGPWLSKMAAPFMPDLSFWFDPASPGHWIGHRMPLFTQGPTVTVVRTGFAPVVFSTGE